MVDAGVTGIVIVGAVPENAVPFDNVPANIPVPVTVRVRVALLPAQIAVDPLIAAEGRSLTVMVAMPVRSAAIAVQPLADKVAMV